MADLVVPQLGESITEAVVARWLKQSGDAVADGEPVAELETDKITVQLPSPAAGAMGKQAVAEGATVKVGQVIGSVEAGAKGTSATEAKPSGAKPPAKAPSKPPADDTPKGPPNEETSRNARLMPAQRAPAGTTDIAAAVGASPNASAHYAAVQSNGKQASLDKDALLKLTPSQRVHARESGSLPSPSSATASGTDPEQRLAKVDPRDEIVPMSPLRKRVAERLVQAQHESASLTTFNEVDMTAILDLRTKYKDSFEKQHGVKLGFMAFFVKACAAAAKLYPGVNAEVIGGNIVYKKHYDFGIAVSAPKGLVVPVLRDVDGLSFAGIEKGIVDLATRAREGKLAMADLTGGTFSITNGGIFGSMMSTPLLNYPQTGILGMHNIVKRAIVIGDDIKARPMMYVALSYDHRVVDGREAVSFLVAVKDRLEAPERLMLEA
ncbi:MAG: 2-oxoglutarate dehydrogenase complex dihydrolipoyllysine-residue succinyltransferase [Deltaproteobacteria bacterium]|nr:2-oxoglutarate dehydrogenase complex dihydrolipoyllysine-residue succinyltransferase [Deltaproteobacteria bacterium]